MPMYLWACKKCAKETEVVRSISEYQTPPQEDDGEGLVYCTVDEKNGAVEHEWERRIPSGSGQFHLVGRGWARDRYS